MASSPLYHDQPAYLHILHMYMKILDDVGTAASRPDAAAQSIMWNEFIKDIGLGYNRFHQLEVQNAQRYLVACLRYNIPAHDGHI